MNLITVCTDERDIVESADKSMTWQGIIRLFASVAYFELVVLLSDCFTVVPKSCAYIVQSTKCFVLKRETRVGFQPALSEVFCTSKKILSTSSFASLNATSFADVLSFFRVFQKPHKDIQGYQLTTVFSAKYQLTVNPIRTLWKVDGDNDECI